LLFIKALSIQPEEISDNEKELAKKTFQNNIGANGKLIISMRKNTVVEQYHHFIFGAALAYCLNRSIIVEMKHYPLTKEQPKFYFSILNQNNGLANYDLFYRFGINRETYCKNETELYHPYNTSILLRNYHQIFAIYGNHYLSHQIQQKFGMHAEYFLAHHYLKPPPHAFHFPDLEPQNSKPLLCVDIEVLNLNGMPEMQNVTAIVNNFTSFIQQLNKDDKYKVVIASGSQKVLSEIKKNENFKDNAYINLDNEEIRASFLWEVQNVDLFVGTFRSQYSSMISTLRGRSGYLVDTYAGRLIKQNNYQAGRVSPFKQNFEGDEWTLNNALRG